MEKQPRHRPQRQFPGAKRLIIECELDKCIHCGSALVNRRTWYVKKHVQTLAGPVFVAGKSKKVTAQADAKLFDLPKSHKTGII